MQASLKHIPIREILHYLGWRGTPVEPELLHQIEAITQDVIAVVQPRFVLRRFAIEGDGVLASASLKLRGNDVRVLLASCHEAVLLAATLGAQSERMLLRAKAQSAQRALLLDATLSAAIEEICDQAENELRRELEEEGLYLTDRFSPGYGDMPMTQTGEICEVLDAAKGIGLTVSKSGIMIPRKSVTAVMGISKVPVKHRVRGCNACAMRDQCTFACRK